MSVTANNAYILIIEDDEDQRALLDDLLSLAGYQILSAGNIEAARALLFPTNNKHTHHIQLILSDWKLQHADGLAFFQQDIQPHVDIPFILMTAYGDVSHAMHCLRVGVDDYLIKPFNKQQLLFSIEKTLTLKNVIVENTSLKSESKQRDKLVDLIGHSEAMQTVYRRLEKVAGSNATVLITGESGTGKELAARAICSLSSRAEKPFISINCAAIPETLFESELFGSEKGAFTGADKRSIGRLGAADGGTLFLDEIGELPLSLQAKLLRLLQEGKYQRLGSHVDIQTDIRIIAATNRDLRTEVEHGRFREDLFYRLNIIPIHLPALRERLDDLPQLTQHFLKHFCEKHQLPQKTLTLNGLNKLKQHNFKGNVRELSNLIERIVILSDQENLDQQVINEFINAESSAQPSSHFELPLEGFDWESHEKELLKQALTKAQENRTVAARLLNMSYKTFIYRLEKYQLIK